MLETCWMELAPTCDVQQELYILGGRGHDALLHNTVTMQGQHPADQDHWVREVWDIRGAFLNSPACDHSAVNSVCRTFFVHHEDVRSTPIDKTFCYEVSLYHQIVWIFRRHFHDATMPLKFWRTPTSNTFILKTKPNITPEPKHISQLNLWAKS